MLDDTPDDMRAVQPFAQGARRSQVDKTRGPLPGKDRGERGRGANLADAGDKDRQLTDVQMCRLLFEGHDQQGPLQENVAVQCHAHMKTQIRAQGEHLRGIAFFP